MLLLLLTLGLLASAIPNSVHGLPRSVWDTDGQPGIREIFNWTQLDFNFGSQQAREQAIKAGTFVANLSMVPIGIAASKNRVFLSIPRFRAGVPATLAYVPYPSNTSSPLLVPYPNLEFNRLGLCSGLTSVFRVKVDECERIWVLDTGYAINRVYCPPKVVVFDLTNDRVLGNFLFPTGILLDGSLPVNIEVEYPNGTCGRHTDAVLYIADNKRFAIVVANLSTNKMWRVTNKFVYPSPEAGTFNVAGETFDLMDGVVGLALRPTKYNDNTLYFSALSSFQQHWVRTAILRNESEANRRPWAFEIGRERRPGQIADYAVDKNGILFFGLVNHDALACWNSDNLHGPSQIAKLAQNNETMQYISTVSIDQSQRLWALSTRFQKFTLKTMDPTEVNFRVFMAESTDDLVKGTICMNGCTA